MKKLYTIENDEPEKSLRLDELLRKKIPQIIKNDVSNSKIRRLIIAGAVFVDGRQIRVPGANLGKKAVVTVDLDEEKLFFEKTPDDISFEVDEKSVLYEDDSIIVVNKPSFFPTEAGMVESRDNLHAAVIRYLHGKNPSLRNPPYVGVMHRLDRETSGVILFTKKRSVNAACHDMFEQHTARKIYHAVVSTVCKEDSFSVDMLMGRISPKSQAAKWGRVKRDGLPSHTDFNVCGAVVRNGKKYSVIECRPQTGRTHQIRVHLASVGLPILGDVLYGGSKFSRIMLHAASLEFPHPETGKITLVSAPEPPEFVD